MIQQGWAPARFASPGIGQPQPTPLVPPVPVVKKSFIDSAAFGALVAAAGGGAVGTIAYVYTKKGSTWGSFFWVLSGLMAFVALDDLSRLRGR
jgi:hypothetical protein